MQTTTNSHMSASKLSLSRPLLSVTASVVSALVLSTSLFACGTSGAAGGSIGAQADASADSGEAEDIFDKKDAKFSLDVYIGPDGVTILGTNPYDPMNDGLPSVSSNTPDSLKWVIEGDDGKILGKGYVPDPRVSEDKVGNKRKAESAMFQLDVPTDQGTLALYENHPTL